MLYDQNVEKAAIGRALEVAALVGQHGPLDDAIRVAVCDALSVALAGSRHAAVSSVRQKVAPDGSEDGRRRNVREGCHDSLGEATFSSPDASVWFTNARSQPEIAAFFNGAAIHAFDYDDTHDAAIVHVTSAILPAALAGAEAVGAGGRSALRGLTAGAELACNLALAATRYGGWHYTTLCGTLGAALAAGVAMGLDDSVLPIAVSNAYAVAGGNKQAVLDSSIVKRFMPGHAARTGISAAIMAGSGIGSDSAWLTGPYGLFQLFYEGSADPDAVRGGDTPRVAELSFKPIPACRFTHGAIEAALGLRARNIPLEGIVHVRYPALDRFKIVCRPYHRRGSEEMDAQFSTAYLVASALLKGEISLSSYLPDALDDHEVTDLAGRVRVTCDLSVSDDRAIAPIEVESAGETVRVDQVLGSPQRPLGPADRQGKFVDCVTWATGCTRDEGFRRWLPFESAVTELLACESVAAQLGVLGDVAAGLEQSGSQRSRID